MAYAGTTFPDLPDRPLNIAPAEMAKAIEQAAAELSDVPKGLQGKVTQGFWQGLKEIEALVLDRRVHHHEGLPLSQVELQAAYGARLNDDGEVFIQIDLDSWSDESLAKLQKNGLRLESTIQEYHRAFGWVNGIHVQALGSLSEIGHLAFPLHAVTNVTSEGDVGLNADDVRSQFSYQGVDGSGIKIGVISDGVTNRSLVGSELPTINVNGSLPGNGNEGTAMLEIIHDLAPGADLYFSSGIGGTVDMANSISWLVGQGVNVIVDDLSFLGEPNFIDGYVASNVASAISGGVTFVSAAGNYAYNHYQGQFTNDGFGYNQFGSDNTLAVYVPAGTQLLSTLQWSDNWTTSNNDYNFYAMRVIGGVPTTISSSTTVQDGVGTDFPFESVSWNNTTGADQYVYLVVQAVSAPASRQIEIFTHGCTVTDSVRTLTDSIFGHAALIENISVGAVNYTSPTTVESYSSQGPSRIYNTASQSYVDRASLDGVATTNVQTRIGQLGYFYNPFEGTSAAAPHVAAIAALLLDGKDEHITPADIALVLTGSAIDIGTSGYDNTSGYGRFDATSSIQAHKIWMNSALDVDVDDNAAVTPLDALLVINDLNANGARALPDSILAEAPDFLDVNGDYYVSPLDALLVINYLNAMRMPAHEENEVIAQVRLETTNLEGESIDEINQGESFYLNVYVKDTRVLPQGVFSAQLEIDFDDSLATVDNGDDLNNVGGILAIEPPGADEQFLYSVKMKANAEGELEFAADSAIGIGSELLLFGENAGIPLDRIDFGRKTLAINS
jgi:hypothetical protein